LLGLGTFPAAKGSGNPAINGSLLLSGETGFGVKIYKGLFLYAGAYIDLSPTNVINKDAGQSLITRSGTANNYKNEATSSVLTAKESSTAIESVSLLGAGVRVRLAYNFNAPPPVSDPKMMELRQSILDIKQGFAKEDAQALDTVPKRAVKDNVPNIIQRPIMFGFKSASILAKQYNMLDSKIAALKNNPEMEIVIYGHANDFLDKKDKKNKKKNEEKNKKLGMDRAKAVQSYLVKKGISKMRIKVVSKGSKSPAVPNTTPRNRNKNRRVEIKIR
jgi:outer membrane protein OmpA-like peptidoglycan-associated protein